MTDVAEVERWGWPSGTSANPSFGFELDGEASRVAVDGAKTSGVDAFRSEPAGATASYLVATVEEALSLKTSTSSAGLPVMC